MNRELSIAVGNNRFETKWKNKMITFDELKDRLKSPVRTSESTVEYAAMTKLNRDNTKDRGGFVGGVLKDGRRTNGYVESRSMLNYDGDYITKEFLDSFEATFPYGAVLYSTHSSTPETPRVRILCPLTRDVTPEEFVAVSRYVAESIGIEYFDECSYRTNQIMYWPTVSDDGVFIYKEVDKPCVDPDVILSSHPEWTDPENLPVSSREKKRHAGSHKKVKDPLTKEGVVGVFNRVYYPITKALEEFLPEVYEPTDRDNRYHYVPSHSVAGVEIIEDKFVYSHHAKDPAYLQLCNAFDIVRVHKFADMDEKDSFRAMSEYALERDEIKLAILEEKRERAEEDFSLPEEDDWRKKLRYMKRSQCLENSVWNLLLILQNDPDFKNIAYNEFADLVEITGTVPWERPLGNRFWREGDMAQMKALIDIRYNVFSDRNYQVAYKKVTEDRHFHPILNWLNNLPAWDGVKRLETLFIDYLGAKDSPYVRAATRKPFVAAVARIYNPGIKFDTITVLVGPQGCGKSTIIARMGKEYYSDSLTLFDMKDKSGAEKLQGYWLLEIGELAGMKKADVELVKAFLSRTSDKYRPAYARTVEEHERHSVIFGTTNTDTGFLRDTTGNRRFWPIDVTGQSEKKPWNLTEEEIAMLWAEAKHLYENGESLILNKEENEEAMVEQINAMENDDRLGGVEAMLDILLPENWYQMKPEDRRYYLNSSDELSAKGTIKRQYVCNAEIWNECFQRDTASLGRYVSLDLVAMMMKSKVWKWTRKKRNIPGYGPHKYYERCTPEEEPTIENRNENGWNREEAKQNYQEPTENQEDDIPF